jgi:hypothetical protein
LHSFAVVDLTEGPSADSNNVFHDLIATLHDHGIQLPFNFPVFDHIVTRVKQDVPLGQLKGSFDDALNKAQSFFVDNATTCYRALTRQEGEVHDVVVLHPAHLAPDVQWPKRAVIDSTCHDHTHTVTIGSTVALAKIMYEVVMVNGERLQVPLPSVSATNSNTQYIVKIGEDPPRRCGAPCIVFKVEGMDGYYRKNEISITGTTQSVYAVDADNIECPAIVFVFIPKKDSLLYSKVKLITNHRLGVQCKLLTVSILVLIISFPC